MLKKNDKKKRSYFKKINIKKINIKKLNPFNKKGDVYSFKEVCIIMIVCILIGVVGTVSFCNLFSVNTENRELAKFIDSYNTLLNSYYTDIDKKEIVDAAINGMMNAVDDKYTVYTDKISTEKFFQRVDGVYEGIGVEVGTYTTGEIIIVTVFENSPADQAGMKVGDQIIAIDGIDYHEKNSTDMSNYIKERGNNEIKFKVIREEKEEIEITVKRDRVEIPSVYSETFERDGKKIGYLGITIFSSVTDTQFIDALLDLEDEEIEGLVIDVRSNSGGYLDVVSTILQKILKKGEVIYQLDNNGTKKKVAVTDKSYREYPIAVLINGSSASASEILAGAIKETYKGIIVGTTSYGKGSVQQTKTLSDGSMIKYTTQKWLTPNGNSIDGLGIEPTDIVELSEIYYQEPTYENDNQLSTAIDLIIEK